MRNKYLKANNFKLKDSTEYLNQQAWDHLVNRYMLKALNVFKWEGLPDNVEPEIIETMLFLYGTVGFCYDQKRGYLTLQCNAYNYMDIYNRPTQCTLIGQAFYTDKNVYWGDESFKTIVYEDKPFYNETNTCVIIKNNDLEIPTFNLLEYKLYQLYNLERTLDVSITQLPLQNIIVGSTQDRASIQELFNKVKRHDAFNAIAGSQLKSDLQGLSLNHDFRGRELIEIKRSIECELYTILGINNVNFEKTQSLLTAEIDANNEAVENELQASLKTREEACRLINDFFGLNVSVSVNKVKEAEWEELVNTSVEGGELDE